MQRVLKFKTTKVPPILKHVLISRNWEKVPTSEPEFDLFWKNGRFTREEMVNPNARYNHFPNTQWITRKVNIWAKLSNSQRDISKTFSNFLIYISVIAIILPLDHGCSRSTSRIPNKLMVQALKEFNFGIWEGTTKAIASFRANVVDWKAFG